MNPAHLSQYLKREKIFYYILVGIAVAGFIASFFLKIVAMRAFSCGLLIALIWHLGSTDRLLKVNQVANASALIEMIDTTYDLLVQAWKDYNTREATRLKYKWDMLVSMADYMQQQGLISKEIQLSILKRNVDYTHKETSIILENSKKP